jgi:glycosyltransferase involved in cell wall biosynthesis
VAITSAFGNPLDPHTWSAAPYNLARALHRQGVAVEGLTPDHKYPVNQGLLALHHLLRGYGLPRSGEQLRRSPWARRRAAKHVTEAALRSGCRNVLHTGTLDMPTAHIDNGLRHYLYCDQTWALSMLHRPDRDRYGERARREYESLERDSLAAAHHIFTFGRYVRDNIVSHYGIDPGKVTVVGSGMGKIEPLRLPKDFSQPNLLFVAKHLFKDKGGPLAIQAFQIAKNAIPDLTLTVVAHQNDHGLIPYDPNITVLSDLPWDCLQNLYRRSTLLVQPMLNDPWGQVYLEALASLTPVIGLDRNGLPEILDDGRFGVQVSNPDPEAIAAAIVQSLSDPEKLAEMAEAGQAHVLSTFSWDAVASRILHL